MPSEAGTLVEERLQDLLDATGNDLRKIYIEMQKPKWLSAVEQLKNEGENDLAKKDLWKKALKAELAVQDAIQEIDAADIADIAHKMSAQTVALRDARKELQQAVQKMEDVAKTIGAVAKVIGVLTKVVSTVGKLVV